MNQSKKSTFVNTLDWLFIIFAGFATFISILQNIMIFTMLPAEEMSKAMKDVQAQEHIPAYFRFMFSNIHIFLLIFLVICVATFVSAIGLLKRKNWARIFFITIMGLGILFNICGLLLQNNMLSSMPEIPNEAMDAQFSTMMSVMKIFSFVFITVISYLLGWIIYKLTSSDIKAEFTGAYPSESGMATGEIGQQSAGKKKIILTTAVVLTIVVGAIYFLTGNIKTTSKGGDIQAIAISGDAAKLSKLLKEQPQLAKAEWGENNWPPLHFAACNGKTECVKLLIEAGANVNAQTCGQGTALHCSAEEGHTEIVTLLLKANADPNIQDSKGKTPLDFAIWNDHKEVVELLKSIMLKQVRNCLKNRALLYPVNTGKDKNWYGVPGF